MIIFVGASRNNLMIRSGELRYTFGGTKLILYPDGEVSLNWLIAEDETDIRNLVSMMTTVWGHTPMAFETGQKVWDWLETVENGQFTGKLPEFALMDIRMPGYRGNEIAARIRKVEKIKQIPIVLMTAFVMSDDERNTMMKESGVDQVINKPLPDIMQLHKLLHDIIANKQSG